MYTILLLQPCGCWTDNIGQQFPDDNRWATRAEAEAAVADLKASGIDGTARVVSLSDLGQYDLIG
jgi:hypothetical protein